MNNKILTCPTEDLPKLLGEVLQPETANYHDQLHAHEIIRHKISPILEEITTQCPKCKQWAAKKLIRINEQYLQIWYSGMPCTVDPIPLAWPNAIKWRDWAVEKFGEEKFMRSLWELFKIEHKSSYSIRTFEQWVAIKAKPHHYLRASAKCAEGESE